MNKFLVCLILQMFLGLIFTVETFADSHKILFKDGKISIFADKVSMKTLLEDISKKTKFNIKILNDVKDYKITSEIIATPINPIYLILDKLGIKNYAVAIEKGTNKTIVYVTDDVVNISKFNNNIAQAHFNAEYKIVANKRLNYGNDKNSVGIYDTPGAERIGPGSYDISSNGELYLADTVNKRVQIFDRNGEYSSTVKINQDIVVSDIMVANNDKIVVYDDATSSLYQYNTKGDLIKEIKVDSSKWNSKLNIEVIGNKISVITGDQKTIIIANLVDGRIEALKDYIIYDGILTESNTYCQTRVERGKKVEVKLQTANAEDMISFNIDIEGVLSSRYLGEGKNGDIYLQIEHLKNNAVGLSVYILNKYGKLINKIENMENNYYTWSAKLLAINKDGEIYQFMSNKKNAVLNIYRK